MNVESIWKKGFFLTYRREHLNSNCLRPRWFSARSVHLATCHVSYGHFTNSHVRLACSNTHTYTRLYASLKFLRTFGKVMNTGKHKLLPSLWQSVVDMRLSSFARTSMSSSRKWFFVACFRMFRIFIHSLNFVWFIVVMAGQGSTPVEL